MGGKHDQNLLYGKKIIKREKDHRGYMGGFRGRKEKEKWCNYTTILYN